MGSRLYTSVAMPRITSANKLSIYGAVADMCEESILLFSDKSSSAGKLVANGTRTRGSTSRCVEGKKITSDQ